MQCCICDCTTQNDETIFQEKIGQQMVSTILCECTDGESSSLSTDSRLCRACIEKLIRYYEAMLEANQIKEEMLHLLMKSRAKLEPEPEEVEEEIEYIVIEPITDQAVLLEEEGIKDEEAEEACEYFTDGHESTYSSDDMMEIIQQDSVVSSLTEEVLVVCDENCSQSAAENLMPVCDDSNNESENQDEGTTPAEEVNLKCSKCEKHFPSEQACKDHYNEKHLRSYICHHCGKELHSQTGFRVHCNDHTLGKQFACHQCPERFSRKIDLKYHMAYHVGEKRFECDECDKRFVVKKQLVVHKRNKHGENSRRYICDTCGKKFLNKGHLDRHLKTHSKIKSHSCNKCGKCFSERYNLNAHMKCHEKNADKSIATYKRRRYRCLPCGRTFRNEQTFKEHCKHEDNVIAKKIIAVDDM